MAKSELRVFRSTSQVAVAVNVTRRTVQKWCEQGLVKCERTPTGQYRVEVDDKEWPLATEEDT
jgi:predicted site-specific integrase-resolvase